MAAWHELCKSDHLLDHGLAVLIFVISLIISSPPSRSL